MRKYLRRAGIAMIVVAVAHMLLQLKIYFFGDDGFSIIIQSLVGIILINGLCIAGGIIAIIESIDITYVARFHNIGLIIILLVPLIVLTTPGAASQKFNALFNLTTIPALVLLYTLALAQREEKQWKIIDKNAPVSLDLRLKTAEDWFNPIQAGPVFSMSDDYVGPMDRYVESLSKEAPLTINLLCAESVSDMMKDTMRETLQMHYEEEENRMINRIAAKYRRAVVTLIISIILIVVWEIIDTRFEDIVYWEIIGNIGAFSLWQAAGFMFYDQGDQFNELLGIRICKHAKLTFVWNE